MSLFDKIKKVVVGEKMSEKPMMKLTMLGARGVGKTSVLTSMYNNMNTAINDTSLHIVADQGTSHILSEKTNALKKMFFSNNDISDTVHAGIAGDSAVSIFNFDFGMNTENINMGLEIRDYPGEYVKKQPNVVKQYIAESNAIIVAIDTPHLMECDGRYNEGKNFTSLITSFFKQTLNAESDEKLIMLVPLKCERYYHEGRINEVTAQVRDTYRDLIRFLKDKDNINGIAGKFACVITPIQTVGEIVFDSFETLPNGEVDELVVDGLPVPRKVNYKYLKGGAVYAPVYCEQPLYYVLSFVGKQYMRMRDEKASSGLLFRLMKLWDLMPNINVFLEEIHRFDEKKADNLDGFVTVWGRGKV